MPNDNRTTIEKLTAAHAGFMKVHVSGEESLTFAQSLLDLTNVINELKKAEEEPK